jgi:hypothetical protein
VRLTWPRKLIYRREHHRIATRDNLRDCRLLGN